MNITFQTKTFQNESFVSYIIISNQSWAMILITMKMLLIMTMFIYSFSLVFLFRFLLFWIVMLVAMGPVL